MNYLLSNTALFVPATVLAIYYVFLIVKNKAEVAHLLDKQLCTSRAQHRERIILHTLKWLSIIIPGLLFVFKLFLKYFG